MLSNNSEYFSPRESCDRFPKIRVRNLFTYLWSLKLSTLRYVAAGNLWHVSNDEYISYISFTVNGTCSCVICLEGKKYCGKLWGDETTMRTSTECGRQWTFYVYRKSIIYRHLYCNQHRFAGILSILPQTWREFQIKLLLILAKIIL